MFRSSSKASIIPPYSRLATIYDYVMRHVDYVYWADYVESLFLRHHLVPSRVLDLACGTGTLALEFWKRDYLVTGVDACREMLDVAEEKSKQIGCKLPFFQKDLLNLKAFPCFDVVLCLYDSINDLMTPREISLALKNIYDVTEPGGLAVFDVCTETNSIRHFRDLTDRDRGDGFSYTRQSSYQNGIQINRFNIHFSHSNEEVCEIHKQRIYPIFKIEELVRLSPFQIEGVYDGFGYNPPTDLSDRVHFVLRSPDE